MCAMQDRKRVRERKAWRAVASLTGQGWSISSRPLVAKRLRGLALLSVGIVGILRRQERVNVLEKVERPIGFVENGDSLGHRRDSRREQQLGLRKCPPIQRASSRPD